MTNKKSVYLTVLIISVSLICFEILSTRISSVIFVHNYAFIILSLAILGLGTGGIFSYYAFKTDNSRVIVKIITRFIIVTGISFIIFIIITTQFSLTNPLLYFFLL
ncbi:MAG: hypothetical protein P8078_12355, partial [bacterium]